MFSSSSWSRSTWRLINSRSSSSSSPHRRLHSTQTHCKPLPPPLLYSNQKYERQILTSANCDQHHFSYSKGARRLVDFLKLQDYQIEAHIQKSQHIAHPALKLIRNYLKTHNTQPQTNRLIVSLLAETLNTIYPQVVDDRLKDWQRSVGEIVELLHLCQLIHRNLLDLHLPPYTICNQQELKLLAQGNKIAILFGDFLFTVAISMMASLYNIEISTLITHTIKGLSGGLYVFETTGDHVLNSVNLDNWKLLNYEICGLNLENGCLALIELLPSTLTGLNDLKSLVGKFGRHFFYAWQTMIEMNQFYELAALHQKCDNLHEYRFDLLSAPIVLDANGLPELVEQVKLSYANRSNQCKPTVNFQLLESHFDLQHLRLPNTRHQIDYHADQALACLHSLCPLPHQSNQLENIIAILKRK